MKFFTRSSPSNSAEPLPAGVPAPDFTLPATTGAPISLAEYHGRPVILVFYPADHSSVCSNQLVLYNEALDLFKKHDAQLLGISTDDVQTHLEFAAALKLAFPLLADIEPPGAVARRYGVFHEADKMSERAMFVIDREGLVHWSYLSPRDQNPGAHGILHALETLDQAR
jgi:peroxiredoxin